MSTLPPGPRFPPALQVAALGRDPVGFLVRCEERWGDLFTLRFPSYPPIVYTGAPALVKAIFTADPAVARAGEGAAPFLPVLGARSLLLLDGEEHVQMRRLLLPAFHGERVRRYAAQMAEIAGAAVEAWPTGAIVALRPRMRAIALEIIVRVVFGVTDPDRRARLLAALPVLVDIPFVGMWFPWLRIDLGPRSPWGRFTRARAEVDGLLREELRARRTLAVDTPGEDVLSLLLASRHEDGTRLTDAELRDQLVTLLVAGHETTATALSWIFERLVRHPAALARLEAEVDAGEGVWLDAVIEETLRVRPVVIDVVRHLAAPLRLGERTLPAGVVVAPSIILTQRRPDVWGDPLAFRPERWEAGPVDPYAWIPFGGGSRRCLGAGFAHAELRAVVSAVLARVRIAAVDVADERQRLHHVTLVPERGTRVRIERRTS